MVALLNDPYLQRQLVRRSMNLSDSDSTLESVSALTPGNAERLIGPWSLVHDDNSSTNQENRHYGMLVDGQPAAVINDNISSGSPVGHFYRPNGSIWSEFATLRFPFGSS